MIERQCNVDELNTARKTDKPAPVHLSREQSRKIKAMGRSELEAYLMRVYHRGYEAGLKAPAMVGNR